MQVANDGGNSKNESLLDLVKFRFLLLQQLDLVLKFFHCALQFAQLKVFELLLETILQLRMLGKH